MSFSFLSSCAYRTPLRFVMLSSMDFAHCPGCWLPTLEESLVEVRQPKKTESSQILGPLLLLEDPELPHRLLLLFELVQLLALGWQERSISGYLIVCPGFVMPNRRLRNDSTGR